MARLIKATGEEEIVRPRGKKFTLEEMYELLRCHSIEMIRLPDRFTMWMDEEGKLKTNMINVKATAILQAVGGRDGIILGHVLICGRTEVS